MTERSLSRSTTRRSRSHPICRCRRRGRSTCRGSAKRSPSSTEPPVAALVVFDANPAASNPNQVRVREGLARDDLFTVVLEQRLTDTTDFADVVLPGHDAAGARRSALRLRPPVPVLERAGRRARRANACRTRRSSAGSPPPWASTTRASRTPTSSSRGSCSTTRGCRRLGHHARARCASVGTCEQCRFERGTAPFADGGFPTPSGKVELLADALGGARRRIRSSATCRRTRRLTTSWPSASRSS